MSHKEWRTFTGGPVGLEASADRSFEFYNILALSDVVLRVLASFWVMTSVIERGDTISYPPQFICQVSCFGGDVGSPAPELGEPHALVTAFPNVLPTPQVSVDTSIPDGAVTTRVWAGGTGGQPISAAGHRDVDGAIAGRHVGVRVGWGQTDEAAPPVLQLSPWTFAFYTRMLIQRTP